MSEWKKKIYKAGLNAMYFTGAHHILAPVSQGVGLIAMLHRVIPSRDDPFQPNRHLEIDPAFLDSAIDWLKAQDFDFVDLDEAQRRLINGNGSKRFLAMTLDDGYLDNIEFAKPIFERHQIPYTIYVATGIIDRSVELWWMAVEQILRQQDAVDVDFDGLNIRLDCDTPAGKHAAYKTLLDWLTTIDEARQRAVTRSFAERYEVDLEALCDAVAMTWDDVRDLASDPLATIGGHTEAHLALAKLDIDAARSDIAKGLARLDEMAGIKPKHFAYPYGYPAAAGQREYELAAEFGFQTAVTTRPGVLFADHKDHLMALPRVSLNGHYQAIKYLNVLTSGSPFALKNGFRRVHAA